MYNNINIPDVSIENMSNGYTYAGEVDVGLKPSGKGIEFRRSGHKAYSGYFKNGFKHGKGTMFYENGRKAYKGEFSKGLMSGEGVMYYNSGKVLYRGTFRDGNFDKGNLYGLNGVLLINELEE